VSLALSGLLVWPTACTSYKQIEPGDVANYGKARVTLDDGSHVVVASPQIQADSLVGFEAESWSAADRAYTYRVRVGLDQIETVEASYTSAGKTVALVGGIVIGVGLIGGLICEASGCLEWEMDWGAQ
jgi:hypothetical protein